MREPQVHFRAGKVEVSIAHLHGCVEFRGKVRAGQTVMVLDLDKEFDSATAPSLLNARLPLPSSAVPPGVTSTSPTSVNLLRAVV